MKAEIIEVPVVEKFKPIKLEITIESEGEAWDLWHRFNIAKSDLHSGEYTSGQPRGESDTREAWRVVNRLLKK